MESWKEQFEIEINNAKSARATGNEGRARVCARRSAGIVIGEFLHGKGYSLPSTSTYDRLQWLNSLPGLPVEVYKITGHLLERVNPNYQLPAEVDLIRDTERLREILLPTE